jgi:hypothetical protein
VVCNVRLYCYDANVLKLEQIIGWFKDEAPTLKVGFYDVAAPVTGLPITGQQPANDVELAIWEMANSYHSIRQSRGCALSRVMRGSW